MNPKQNKKSDPQNPGTGKSLFWALMAVLALALIHDFVTYSPRGIMVPYGEFLNRLSQGKVDSVMIASHSIEGVEKADGKEPGKSFYTFRMEDPELVKKLEQSKVKFGATQENTLGRDLFSWLLPAVLMLGLWVFLSGRMSAGGALVSLGKSKAKMYSETDSKVRFSDVAGVDEAKQELQEVVHFLKDPASYTRLGGRMPKGVLLVGPPGTGKTLLARAVAGEASVPFFSINGSEFVELFVGLGAARVRDLFAQARSEAPCILFIDELDALGKARGISAVTGSANDEKEQTLNQLLAEIDGFDPSKGVVLLAATNRPEILDPALLRSGRFDRQVLIDRPDKKGRSEIIKVHLKKVKAGLQVNADQIAALTTGFSGADLANLVNEAALIATRRNALTIEQQDLTEAVERIVAGLERRSRVISDDEKRRVAYHEMGHTIVGMELGQNESVQKVSIIPRGMAALGYTLHRPTEDRYLMGRHELEGKLAMLLAGRASEEFFLKEASTGAADDFSKASEMARAMVTRYGMSDLLGVVSYEDAPMSFLGNAGTAPWMKREYSELTAREIDHEVKEMLDAALGRALRILKRHQKCVEKGVSLLLAQETLGEKDIEALSLELKHQELEPELNIYSLAPN